MTKIINAKGGIGREDEVRKEPDEAVRAQEPPA